MTDENSPPRSLWKVFPRNLTARADRLVLGNPMSSRPESGVNNSFPGLEFDQRVLDERFFPGLRFEFQRPDGAVVVEILSTPAQRTGGLSAEDATAIPLLYLWFLYGSTIDDRPSAFLFHGRPGWEAGRRVRDLRPGRVAIIIGGGPPPPFSDPFAEMPATLATLDEAYRASGEYCAVTRDPATGRFHHAVLATERARYLDADGVIDVDAYPPGELTKSLCAPWMYDFRDCYCFYWASNKPDLVDVVDAADGETLHRYVNFIRGDRSMPPARDVATWTNRDGAPTPLKHGVQGPPEPWQRRRDTELTYQDMVEGWWHRLPVVLDDREQPAPSRTPAPRPAPADLLTRNEAVAELRYLATVEHALVVEYLYAYYSLTGSRSTRAPFREPSGPIDIAANELFQIAIDEMRHLLWANELLRLLGEKEPSTGRAEIIGQEPIDGSGRKIYPGRQYHPRKFKLRRLSSLAFKLFIEVERASQSENAIQSASPGMYIEVLRSVTNPDRARFPDQGNVARLGPIVKLIIDEGVGHYHRFEAIQKALRGLKRRDYLRPFRGSADSTSGSLALVELCRHYYHSILEAIHIGFSMGEEVGGDIVRAAVRSMESFDDTARMLVERDIPPPFDHPGDLPRKAGSPDVAIRILDAREQRIGQALASASATGDAAVVRHARRHSELVGPHFARIRAGVRRRAGS